MLRHRQSTPMPPVRQRLRDLILDLSIGAAVAIAVAVVLVYFYGVLLPR